jgi:hypothetical protein
MTPPTTVPINKIFTRGEKVTDRLKDGELRFVKINMSNGTVQYFDRLIETVCSHCNQTLSQ